MHPINVWAITILLAVIAFMTLTPDAGAFPALMMVGVVPICCAIAEYDHNRKS